MIEKKEFAILMSTLYEIYDKEGSATKTELYFNLLEEYPIEIIKKAVTKILKSRIYSSFPKPSDIIEAIEGSKEDLKSTALDQFQTTNSAAGNQGPYRNVKFDDPIIHIVLTAMGGWNNFCMFETSRLHWIEEEFVEKYCMFYKQFKHGELPENIVGLLGMHANSPSNTTRTGLPVYQLVHTNHPREAPKQIEEPHNERLVKNVLKELGKKIKEKNNDF